MSILIDSELENRLLKGKETIKRIWLQDMRMSYDVITFPKTFVVPKLKNSTVVWLHKPFVEETEYLDIQYKPTDRISYSIEFNDITKEDELVKTIVYEV